MSVSRPNLSYEENWKKKNTYAGCIAFDKLTIFSITYQQLIYKFFSSPG